MSLPDGLDDLDKRARKTRTAPPPRHAKREAAPIEEKAPARPEVARAPEIADESIRLVQVYLPQSADDWLRQVRAEALLRRKDVTASAAVRYALETLMATTTPAELVELLGQKPTNARKGRTRR